MSAAASMSRVHAVVVTYIPDIHGLRDLLVSLAPQVECMHVVDNTPQTDTRVADVLLALQLDNVLLQRLGGNFGIARAINQGASEAIAIGATHVLLSDQDSTPAPDMVQGLLRAERELRRRGVRVGAIGPTFTDAHTGLTFPFQVERAGRLFYGHAQTSEGQPLVETLSLISSGCLIPADAWQAVGTMREDYFIDHVDIEWSHRARTNGYCLYGTAWATMAHRMGDSQIRLWYFGWQFVSAYPPIRVYYRVRNFIALCKENSIPISWKLRNAIYWIKFVYAHVVFSDRKMQSLRMALRGLRDGLRGRMGPWTG